MRDRTLDRGHLASFRLQSSAWTMPAPVAELYEHLTTHHRALLKQRARYAAKAPSDDLPPRVLGAMLKATEAEIDTVEARLSLSPETFTALRHDELLEQRHRLAARRVAQLRGDAPSDEVSSRRLKEFLEQAEGELLQIESHLSLLEQTFNPQPGGAVRRPADVGGVERLQKGDRHMVPTSPADRIACALRQVAGARTTLIVEQRNLLAAISETIKEVLRTEFREIRSDLKLTHSDMSRLTGIPITTLARWETGKAEASLPLLNRFCNKLGGIRPRSPSLDRLVEVVADLNAITIPHLRECLGLTHATFARVAGVTRIMVIGWEKGENEPRLRSLLTLCERLGQRLTLRPRIARQSSPYTRVKS